MKRWSIFLASFMAIFLLVACGNTRNGSDTEENEEATAEETADANGDKLQVVTTNSIIEDMVVQVAGDLVEIHNIVPVGRDPHEFDPLPTDMTAVSNADVIFYNGIELEIWFPNLMEATGREAGVHYFPVSDGVDIIYLTGDGVEGMEDPHAWLSVENGIIYVENITRILSEKDPANADAFAENAEGYIAKLQALHDEWVEAFANVPAERNFLVTSEGAFNYFARSYGVNVGYIWPINTEEEGTPTQFTNIISLVNDSEVPVLFVESSVDSRYMEQVSRETDREIYEELFTDSVAPAGHEADTFYGMMRWNFEAIYSGFNQ